MVSVVSESGEVTNYGPGSAENLIQALQGAGFRRESQKVPWTHSDGRTASIKAILSIAELAHSHSVVE